MLWGDLTWGTLLGGVLVALLVVRVFPLPAVEFSGAIHPLSLARLVGHFVVDLVRASFQVALLALSRARAPKGAVIGVQLRTGSELIMTLTAELSTLVPGTLVVEANRRSGVLYLHILDVETLGGVEQVRADTLGIEERVLRALATRETLDAIGLAEPGDNPRPGSAP
jgi:multicomponent Na+:H+ antiporter subunit E